MRPAKRLKRWLILGHRWLGIVTCLLFVVWFGSGLVMMSVGFPALTEEERRAGLPVLALDRVAVTPDAALAAAGQTDFPRALRLEMQDGGPVYRVTAWDGTRHAVSAVTGSPLAAVPEASAVAAAAHDPRAVRPRPLDPVERDQWSVTARYDPLRPFHRVALGDPDDTVLYVSARTGEVALDTSARERLWNWFGAIPHWIYLTPLRAQAALWRDVVLWVSGIATAGAVTGLVVGLLRLRPRRGFRLTPHRGWAAWHHLGGLVGGVTLVTFVASGWLSVNPNRWFGPRAPSRAMLESYAGNTAPTALDLDAVRAGACRDPVEVRFARIGGAARALIACRGAGLTVAPAEPPEAMRARIARAARLLLPEAPPPVTTLLSEEDAYWYAHHRPPRLPVLRVAFDDPAATWFHLDPVTGEVLDRLDRSGRVYRWLFHAPHSFDLGILLRHRAARDLLLWGIIAAGMVVSVSGTVVGWRRLRRNRI
ncbi:PepSY domain-containing protein [Methylobacterium oryzihabitans]|uniref:PepSY domain-containing protein n=1 Tax=Methylobacterium oryzihabitans TaxID=2499852 RepID=A0A3S2XPG6_9HYPH|nr:PepSY domain-containing protein [Methylobacterium oryzihabitans]RVU19780.1 PepSY domain-containing protein [Methylobacterium oryzihabitans]